MELQLWLMKHLCENCGGTLTPIDGYVADCSEDGVLIQSGEEGVEKAVHTCNSCGARRPDRVFDMIVQAEMAAAGVDEDSDGDSGGDTGERASRAMGGSRANVRDSSANLRRDRHGRGVRADISSDSSSDR
jgi:hypothetical protein